MRNVLASIAISAMFLSTPAWAGWSVAQSRHFVIYSEKSPKELREFATKLERFDQAARVAMSMDDPDVGKGNRLTVFELPTVDAVEAVAGDKSGWVAGFYRGRVNGSLAYVPQELRNPQAETDTIFFHEYSHHLMEQDLQRPYPLWYVEGFAEFLSTATIDKDGSVWFGAPLQRRARVLLDGPRMDLATLAAGIQPKFTDEQRDLFYGRG